jgi:CelD/BcsL family acetyltransferase involved in cellulose biosynthesis
LGRLSPSARVVSDASELADLEPGWNALSGAAGSGPAGDFGWTRACVETFADEGEPHVVVMGDPPRAIAPLVRSPSFHSRLVLAGVADLYEPTDFLYADQAALDELAEALAALGRPLFLGRIPSPSPSLHALGRVFRSSGAVLSRGAGSCPYVELEEGSEPESLLSKRRRSDMRRARRKAEELGEVTTEAISPKPDEVEPLLGRAFEVEARGWKGRSGTALAHDARRADFYRNYATAAAANGSLRLLLMRIEEKEIAFQLGIDAGGSFWMLKIGYDEEYGRASPGQLLMLESIRSAIERGLRGIEFLGSEAPWTQMWTKETRPCISAAVYPFRPRGASAAVSDAAWLGASALRSRIRKSG